MSASRESGAPLDDWLSFDAATMTFSGMPPSYFVGAVPVRIDIEGAGGLPGFSIITEAVVDETLKLTGEAAFGTTYTGDAERLYISAPEDFNGTLVFSYDAKDEKGGESEDPALIFFNVLAEREAPVAGEDRVELEEGGSTTFAVADLLLNDRDDDGDPLRITGFGTPAHGTLSVALGLVTVAAPASIAPLATGTWTATLADGSALPDWIGIDPVTGTLTAEVPLDVMATLSILFTQTDGTTTLTGTTDVAFDGNAGATVTYVPEAEFWGEDPLEYTLTDDAEGPSTGTVILDVASRLDPPVAVKDSFSVDEDSFLTLTPADLLANDYDVDGDPIRFVSVQDAVNGTIGFDGTGIRFTPTADFSGFASFTYTVTDDTHGESTGIAEIHVVSTNQRPVAEADVFDTVEDEPFVFTIADLLANDTDLDGDTLSFVSIQSSIADARIIELPGGRYQFVPDENINGPREFSYSITDGRLTARGTVTFEIEAVNDAPIANEDGHFHGEQDTPLVIDFADLIFNDRDVEGDAFEIVDVFDGDNGTVTRVGDTAVFLGREGYFGDGGFHYRVTDEHGATSTGYVTVLIFPEFDVPVAVSDAGFEMLEDTFLDIDPAQLMANDEIPLGSEVTFLGLTAPGVVSLNSDVTLLENGMYRVTPHQDFFGTLTLRYSIVNEIGFEVPTTVEIEVLPLSDAPVATDDRFTMVEDQPLVIFLTELTDNDYDVDRQAFTITRIFNEQGVTVEDLGDGQLLITPAADFTGVAGFDYEITDTTGISDQAHVTLSLASANDAPVIADPGTLMALEDQPLSIDLAGLISDPDGDTLVVELRSPGGAVLPSWLSFDIATRTLTGTPPQDFNGEILLELSASDGIEDTLRSLTLNIVPVNDAPVITSAGGASTVLHTLFENATFVTTVTASDLDGDTLEYTISGGADAALFTVDALSGALSFLAAPDYEAPADSGADNLYDVIVSASDGLASAEQRLSVAVMDAEEGGPTEVVETDEDDSKPWTSRTQTLGSDGELVQLDIRYDDGRQRVVDYANGSPTLETTTDEGAGLPWTEKYQAFDATGQMTERGVSYDDGRTVVTTFEGGIRTAMEEADTGDVRNWASKSTAYDDTGAPQSVVVDYDDGRVETVQYTDGVIDNREVLDQDDIRDWTRIFETFDETGVIETRQMDYDDGREKTETFTDGTLATTEILDLGDAFVWTSQTETHDPATGLILAETVFDDGRVMTQRISDGIVSSQKVVDAADAYWWRSETRTFSDDGTLMERTVIDDGGSAMTYYF